jgi:putative acetyltransferase
VDIRPVDFQDPQVLALLREHLTGMHANTPAGQVYALDLSGLQRPEITFVAAWDGENLLGFGALKELAPGRGEIKSMRTARAHLRRGVGARILDHLLALARSRRYHTVSLETGSGPAFEPALTLYRKAGFTRGDAFGEYVASPFNQFFHLGL